MATPPSGSTYLFNNGVFSLYSFVNSGATTLYAADGSGNNAVSIQALGPTNFVNAAASISNRVVLSVVSGGGASPYDTKLLVTDGTQGGTQLLTDLPLADAAWGLTTIGNNAIIQAHYPDGSSKLYGTNGTPGGTQLLLDPGNGGAVNWAGFINNRLIVDAVSSSDARLYASDGTTSGTQLLADLGSASYAWEAATVGNNAVIQVDFNDSSSRIYVTNATPGGTQLLLDPGIGGSTSYCGFINNHVIIAALSGGDAALYASDGTPGGTQQFADLGSAYRVWSLVTGSNDAILQADFYDGTTKIYGTDGTASGTQFLFDASGASVNDVATSLGQTFFTVTGGSGVQLYATDGTAADTHLIISAPPGTTFSITNDNVKNLVETSIPGAPVQRQWINPADGSVVAAGDEFIWTGPVSGAWNTASNWQDTTTGANPATGVPGSNDSATFTSPTNLFQVISGTGKVAYLTLTGENLVTGTLTTGALASGPASSYSYSNQLDIGSGGSITAATATLVSDTVTVAAGQLSVSGTLSLSGYYSSLAATGGGQIQVGGLVLGDGVSGLTVDATSWIEVGTASSAAAGALTVDNGATLSVTWANGGVLLSGGGVIDNGIISVGWNTSYSPNPVQLITYPVYGSLSGLSGNGQVVLQDGASASTAYGSVDGSLAFQLGKGASLTLGQVAAGNTISLTGGDVLALQGQPDWTTGTYRTTYDMQAAISGFDATDAITIDSLVTSATYTPDPVTPDTGSLVLTNGANQVVATLTLNGSYVGDSFLVVPLANTTAGTEIVISAAAAPPSTGTSTGDSFTWIGPVSGDWNTAANWQDITSGANPASVAPGGKDSVTFNSRTNLFQVISGVGNAANLTLNGENVVTGTLTTGGLANNSTNYYSNSNQLAIGSGGSITAATATLVSDTVTVTGGQLSVSGTLSLAQYYSSLAATGGGKVQAGNLVLGTGFSGLTVDATSSIEVGHAGSAAGGALTVDGGATLSVTWGNGAALLNGGDVIDNGMISVARDTTYSYSSPTPVQLVTYAGYGPLGPLPHSLSGSGQVVLLDGASASTTYGNVGAGSLTFDLGKGASLALGKVVTGNTINLTGGGDVLTLQGQQVFDPVTQTYGARIYGMQAAISGFDATDAITFDSLVSGATYTAGTTSGTGSLVLTDGANQVVATLALNGSYAGDTFLAVPVGASKSEIVLAAAPAFGPSPGTAAGDAFTWIGPVSGDWNTAASWQDTTKAAPASVAPGAKDSVTFTSPTNLAQVIGGTGNAAHLTLNGDNAVTGTLAVGTLNSTGLNYSSNNQLVVSNGASITADSASLLSDTVAVLGGTLSVDGTLSLTGYYGSLAATGGGKIQAGSLAIGTGVSGLTVDATSSIEVGGARSAADGALTVDAGATLAAATAVGTLLGGGNVIDNGTITIAVDPSYTYQNTISLVSYPSYVYTPSGYVAVPYGLSGSGQIVLQTGVSASTANGSVAAGSLAFQLGKGASLTLGQVGAGNTISLTGGDALALQGQTTTFDPVTGNPINTIDMQAAISGFDATDAITFNGLVTNATYNPGSVAGTGSLMLSDGATQVANLTLNGNYSGDTFLVSPTTSTTWQVSLFQGTVFVSGNVTTVSAQSGATVSLDALLADPTYAPGGVIDTLVIDGPGTVAANGPNLTIHNLEIAGGGTFVLNGAVVKTDPVTVDDNGDVSGFGTITGVVTDNGLITATGGTLELTDAVTGTGTLAIGDQGTLKLDGAVDAGLTIAFQPGANETLVLGTAPFAGTLLGFAAGDKLQLNGQSIDSASISGTTLTVELSGVLPGGVDTLTYSTGLGLDGMTFSVAQGTDGQQDLLTVLCFLAGTRILTDHGEVPVEDLREGDLVATHGTGGPSLAPVRWIGRRRIDVAAHPRPADARPIRIRRDAMAPGQPHRDLLVSPDHAVFLDGALVPAKLLVNGMTIVQDDRFSRVEYVHVELDRHAILISEGLPTESYLDTGNRAIFENAGLALVLHPDFSIAARMQTWNEHACAPLVVAPAAVEPVWRRLAARAEAMGFTPPAPVETTSDPNLCLMIAGRTIRPIITAGCPAGQHPAGRYIFMLPPGATSALLCSRAASPAQIEPFHEDRRRLGVAVRRLRIHGDDGLRDIPVDAPALTSGWWTAEHAPGGLWRWTDGAASVPVPAGATMLEVDCTRPIVIRLMASPSERRPDRPPV